MTTHPIKSCLHSRKIVPPKPPRLLSTEIESSNTSGSQEENENSEESVAPENKQLNIEVPCIKESSMSSKEIILK